MHSLPDFNDAAKRLQKALPSFFPELSKPKLSACQEALSRALKFRDFHEAQAVLSGTKDVTLSAPETSDTDLLKNAMYIAFYYADYVQMPDLKVVPPKVKKPLFSGAGKLEKFFRMGVLNPAFLSGGSEPIWTDKDLDIPLLTLVGDPLLVKTASSLPDSDTLSLLVIRFCLNLIPLPYRERSWRIRTAMHPRLRTLALGMVEEARKFVLFSVYQITGFKNAIIRPEDHVFWLSVLGLGSPSVRAETAKLLRRHELEKECWDRVCRGEMSVNEHAAELQILRDEVIS